MSGKRVMDWWSVIQAFVILAALFNVVASIGVYLDGGDWLERLSKAVLWGWIAFLRLELREAGVR